MKSELDKGDSGLPALRVEDAAKAVIRSEMQQRAVALAARVAEMQRKLVEQGSTLQWLARADVFPMKNGKPADDAIRNTVWRMDYTPGQWVLTTSPREQPFAQPSGAQRWQAAFEALKRDATTPLPDDPAYYRFPLDAVYSETTSVHIRFAGGEVVSRPAGVQPSDRVRTARFCKGVDPTVVLPAAIWHRIEEGT